MATRTQRHVETRKKKARRRIDRPKQSRPQGNTAGIRKAQRKSSLLRQGREDTAASA